MAINFDKHAQEGNEFVNRLARELGHPDETGRTGIILRAVLHTLRDSMTVPESLHLLAQLPMFMKGLYVENWTYLEKPLQLNNIEDFEHAVENHQQQYGEREFNWDMSTKNIIQTVLGSLKQYVSAGQAEHIIAQMKDDFKKLFEKSLMNS